MLACVQALCLDNRVMTSEDVQTNLRIPAALKNALVDSAAKNNRSLSAEVTFRLVQSFSVDSSILQGGERLEMQRERHSLRVLRDTILASVNLQKAALSIGREHRKTASVKKMTPAELELDAAEEAKIVAAIAEAEARLIEINERLAEIEADLKLPDWPSELAQLAGKMPR